MSTPRTNPKPIVKQLFAGMGVVTVCCWDGDIRRFADLFFDSLAEAQAFADALTPREAALRVRAAAWIKACIDIEWEAAHTAGRAVAWDALASDRAAREEMIFSFANATLAEVLA